MRRREFIAGLGGAVAWPTALRAELGRERRLGVLTPSADDDPESLKRLAAFVGRLREHRWASGSNLRIDYRWGAAAADRFRKYAAELVALAPDVILATSGIVMVPLLEASRAVPIVFVAALDPVGAGYVASLARPGGNATGFITYEYGIAAKWLELLKQIAPGVKRIAVMRNASLAGGAQFGAIQAVAPSLGTQLVPIDPGNAAGIQRAITSFAGEPNGGLIVTGSALAQFHRKQIVALAADHRLPAVYHSRLFVIEGGLISYGTDTVDQYRLAADYVDRILRGEKPADLPVQVPTKYELVINRKTGNALGLNFPLTLLGRADEVIE